MSAPEVKCPECDYSKPRNMGTHLFFVHGYSKQKIAEWRMNVKADMITRCSDSIVFRCRFCPKSYKRQNSCRAHERVVHCMPSSQKQKCVPCPLRDCDFTTTALLDLCAHAKEVHSELGDFTIKEARFENMTYFQAWRLQYEDSTSSVLATESVNNNAAAGTTLRYLRCAQLEAQIRRMRAQMSRGEMMNHTAMQDDFDEEEQEEAEEQEEEEKMVDAKREETSGQEAVVAPVEHGTPRRSARKRRHDELEEVKEEEEKMPVKREDEVKSESAAPAVTTLAAAAATNEEEEEDVDVEQVDDMEESVPSSFTPSVPAGPSKGAIYPYATRPAPTPRPAVPPVRRRGGYDRAPPPHLHRENSVRRDGSDEDENEAAAVATAEVDMQQRKLNSRHCTAHMRVLILRTGAVHVEYCSAHLGHAVTRMPSVARSDRRLAKQPQQLTVRGAILEDAEADIEQAKMRRKGRRETQLRWVKERRAMNERDEFAQLCNQYDDIGANVELYEAPAEEDVYEEEVLEVEELIEEEVVDNGNMVRIDRR